MEKEFLEKIKKEEYISNNLYTNIIKTNPTIIPINFNINTYNDNILERDYIKYKDYFENMYKTIDDNIHLDKEQIKAILTDEDYSLIIAGAGTGKTTTMASKVKYLVDIKGVHPSKIAVMSFTKKATMELETRIVEDFNIPAYVTTFHSLGLRYIREIFKDKKCYVVDIEEKNEIFINYFKEKIFPYKDKIKELLKIFSSFNINKPFLFSNYFKENYEKYKTFDEFFESYKAHTIKNCINIKKTVLDEIEREINNDDFIITIQGEIVKSKGEAIIANFLYTNGIKYEYERIYREVMKDRRTYKPDFTIEVNNQIIYIEYFGLSNYKDNELYKYEKNRKIKEEYHRKNHTKFISIDYMRGENIEETLKTELLKMGVTLKTKTYEEIYDRILSNNPTSQIFQFKNFLYDIINLIKSSEKRKEYQEIINNYIISSSNNLQHTMKRQFYYINEFYHYYQEKLFKDTEKYGFDYSDMIYYANQYIEKTTDTENLQFDYLIIDEYQDISEIRYKFTKKISDKNKAKIVAVGDDWQSIYAFTGSKIKYVYNFEKYFEGAKLLKITNTYRNSQELIDYSGKFIMKNKDQIQKELISNKSITSPIKFISYNEEEGEYSVLKKLIINIHKENPTHKIMILGRTNKVIDDFLKEKELIDGLGTKIEFIGYKDIEIDGMTIHKSKGLTSDEVIIIGLNNSFPKTVFQTFWLENIFKPKSPKESIPYAEERRIFYVALTRTKNYVYLLVNEDTKKNSPFVNEIYYITMNEEKIQN